MDCAKVYWKQKHAEQAKKRGRERKLKAIDYLGGICVRCDNKFHPSVFEFHHRDPMEKDFQPSQVLQHSWENFRKELDKCDLMCANCHRLTHHEYGL